MAAANPQSVTDDLDALTPQPCDFIEDIGGVIADNIGSTFEERLQYDMLG